MWLLCLTFLGMTVSAEAKPQRPLAPGVVEVTSPSAGTPLVAGEEVLLAWKPLGSAAAALEEWEAFLSLDGGATYPVRLTPHLDADVRSFAARLPEAAARDARLLLRFGDGEVEWEVPLALRFEIAPALLPSKPSRRVARRAGEAARPGLPGITSWLEGTGRGRDLVTVVVAQEDLSARLVPWVVPVGLDLPAERPISTALAPSSERVSPLGARPRPSPVSRTHQHGLDPRLATCRSNE